MPPVGPVPTAVTRKKGLGMTLSPRQEYRRPSTQTKSRHTGSVGTTSTLGTGERVPFDEDASLEVLTDRAVAMAEAVAEPYGYLLRQVLDCYPVSEGPLYDQQRRGASYNSLAVIGHKVGMTKAERGQWYSIAEAVPLSQRHAGHILSRLKRRAA
jgi:hypothetical protein